MRKNIPFIYMKDGWWIVYHVLHERTLDGVVVIGKGRKVRTAWNAYARKYNWYKRGCPGLAAVKTARKQQRQAEEAAALHRAIKGP